MNKIQLLVSIVIILLISSCSNKSTSSSKNSEQSQALQTEQVTFKVKGMDCTGCEETIEANVKQLDGISKVIASHTEQTAIVEYDPQKSDTKKIKKAISESGYEVTGTSQLTE